MRAWLPSSLFVPRYVKPLRGAHLAPASIGRWQRAESGHTNANVVFRAGYGGAPETLPDDRLGGVSPAQHSVTACAIILWTEGA